MLKNLIPQDELDIVGRIEDTKAYFILDLITTNNLKKCIEIGVWKGSSLFTIADAVRKIDGHVTGIDPWTMTDLPNEIPHNPGLSNHIMENIICEQKTLDHVYNQLISIINNYSLQDYISVIRNRSDQVHNNFANESIDFIHIDGNHDEVNVSKDIINYLPKIKTNGYFLLDDIEWPGVYAAYEKHLKEQVNTIQFGATWACFQKK